MQWALTLVLRVSGSAATLSYLPPQTIDRILCRAHLEHSRALVFLVLDGIRLESIIGLGILIGVLTRRFLKLTFAGPRGMAVQMCLLEGY